MGGCGSRIWAPAQKGRGGVFREFVGRRRGRGRVADDRLRQEEGKRKEG